MSPPAGAVFAGGPGFSPGQAVSPDGRSVVFMAVRDGEQSMLWIRGIDQLDARPLDGTETGVFPFWSPDSRSVAFFALGKLKRIDLDTGAVQIITDAIAGEGGTWNHDGVIVFAANETGALSRVSVAGGTPEPATTLTETQSSHRWPHFLPDGRRFLYMALPGNQIHVGSLDGGVSQALFEAGSKAVYAPPGYILFVRDASLLAQRVDERTLASIGEPVVVAEDVRFAEGNGRASFSLSGSGVLAYRTGGAPTNQNQIVWLDRRGTVIRTFGTVDDFRSVSLSPDATQAIVHRHVEPAGGNLWILDLVRDTMSRFTFGDTHEGQAVWSPDGTRLVFDTNDRRGEGNRGRLLQNITSGTGDAELLLEPGGPVAPTSWTREAIVYTTPSPTSDIWMLPLTGARSPQAVVQSPSTENDGKVSPDGRWLAYMSDETGQYELYVRSFPSGPLKQVISTAGGVQPRWGRDGRELLYLTDPDPARGPQGPLRFNPGAGLNTSVMSVAIQVIGDRIQAERPEVLFRVDRFFRMGVTHLGPYGLTQTYDVSRDGERFLVIQAVGTDVREDDTPMTVVVNWLAQLRQ